MVSTTQARAVRAGRVARSHALRRPIPAPPGGAIVTAMDAILSSAVRGALEQLHELLDRRFGGRLLELAVFGSHARGEAHEESDVDVLVVIDGLTDDEKRTVFDLAYDVDRAQPDWLGIHPLVLSRELAAELRHRERRLFRDIDREGIRL